MQNIDKITIAVVALLLVVGFGYPFLISDPGSEYSSKISEANDKIDENNCIPDFAVLIYPAWLVEQGSTLIEDIKVTPETPPMFLAHAADDPVTCLSSVGLFAALNEKKVPAELHVFTSGGHGYGGRSTGERDFLLKKRQHRVHSLFRCCRRLIGVINTGEILNLPRSGFFVEPLWISGLRSFKTAIDEDLNKFHASFFMNLAYQVPISHIGRDEAR